MAQFTNTHVALAAPSSKKPRPVLPVELSNPLLKTIKEAVVKYQVIEREGQEIIIGRVKVPTPNGGHAFILRRFDTGAVSLTTMFRAAYPDASEQSEKADTAWVKIAYDCSGANGKGTGSAQFLRLAGTWLPADVALSVAESYAITKMVKPLVEATPDVGQQYRKSTTAGNATQENDEKPVSVDRSKPITPAAKRRKGSPTVDVLSPQGLPAAKRQLRASKSPVPPSKTPVKPRSKRQAAAAVVTPPPGSDELEEDPLADDDIAESKKLVEEVKVAYGKPASKKGALKRIAEEEKITFEPKEPEIGERVFAGPRRLRNLPPQRQAVAWGALAFAIGLGATAFLPQFF